MQNTADNAANIRAAIPTKGVARSRVCFSVGGRYDPSMTAIRLAHPPAWWWSPDDRALAAAIGEGVAAGRRLPSLAGAASAYRRLRGHTVNENEATAKAASILDENEAIAKAASILAAADRSTIFAYWPWAEMFSQPAELPDISLYERILSISYIHPADAEYFRKLALYAAYKSSDDRREQKRAAEEQAERRRERVGWMLLALFIAAVIAVLANWGQQTAASSPPAPPGSPAPARAAPAPPAPRPPP